jgi:serine/threonine-protein kinase HipA
MHPACARRFFGTPEVPTLDYTLEQLDDLARQVIADQTSLTGVQPKLSLHLQQHAASARLTIVGLWGGYICKPQTPDYPQMPELEDLTMHLAELAKIQVVPHTLLRMSDGSLTYLTRRIDRTASGEKIAMEDLCQLTGHQTEHKYKCSYERVGKTILQYSQTPQLDLINYFEVVFFCWLTGNNDMHLKNFSLYEPDDSLGPRLTPAYDLLNAALVNPADDEELALTLNARKKKLRRSDFLAAATTLGLEASVVERLFEKYRKLLPRFEQMIHQSFLTPELQEGYCAMLRERIARIEK